MNRSLFLHVIERLEGLVGRLPATIQKPILSELTPLKELFLKQRPPRFVFTGSANTPFAELMASLFPEFLQREPGPNFQTKALWRDYAVADRGTISLLDARNADSVEIEHELEAEAADVIFFVEDEDRKKIRKESLENLASVAEGNRQHGAKAGVIGVIYDPTPPQTESAKSSAPDFSDRASRLLSSLKSKLHNDTPVLRIVAVRAGELSERPDAVIAAIARQLPNAARIEAARVFGHSETQLEVAQLLVKSTAAICTAVGAQPIPLADLPILTTLQLVMVSGIMYVSGRERSLRAATEFIAALGAGVGAGMLLREGARALLKLVPGWGNVICGMVAGAGTYAIGRAAIAYFLQGVSMKDARRAYLRSRKKKPVKTLPSSSANGGTAPASSPEDKRKRLRLRG
jgi:uncharacterized protein (DUF697 family)